MPAAISQEERDAAKAPFRAAVTLLGEQGITRVRLAKGFGVALNTLDKWLLPDYSLPPKEWPATLRRICEEEAQAGVAEAETRAAELRRIGASLAADLQG